MATDPSRTTPLGMLRYGIEFFAAALAADDELGDEEGHDVIGPIPVNYLVGHAIELGLKAYLLQAGTPLDVLKDRIGHNLERALADAEAVGLGDHMPIDLARREFVRLLNTLYATKQFEYIQTGFKTFPVFGDLQRLARDVLMAAVRTIPNAEGLLHRKAGRRLTGMH